MSRVTNVIMTHSLGERKTTNGPAEVINAALRVSCGGQCFGPDVDDENYADSRVGGSKRLETCVFLAAFNHVEVDAIRSAFSMYPWEEPTLAQIMICDHEEDAFSVETAADIRAGKPRQKVEL